MVGYAVAVPPFATVQSEREAACGPQSRGQRRVPESYVSQPVPAAYIF